jgi:hypothetical protein
MSLCSQILDPHTTQVHMFKLLLCLIWAQAQSSTQLQYPTQVSSESDSKKFILTLNFVKAKL